MIIFNKNLMDGQPHTTRFMNISILQLHFSVHTSTGHRIL